MSGRIRDGMRIVHILFTVTCSLASVGLELGEVVVEEVEEEAEEEGEGEEGEGGDSEAHTYTNKSAKPIVPSVFISYCTLYSSGRENGKSVVIPVRLHFYGPIV